MNIKITSVEKRMANILKVLGSPFRVRLLFTIGHSEACVCHLEAVLKKRQAYISQHLMVLRDADILKTRRDGKYIFYRIADDSIFELLEIAAAIQKISPEMLPKINEPGTQANCACPKCEPENSLEKIE
ncbi:MAG: helix-turn-helix transcriptional regulator [Anaerolineales bacterium]|nr:helix-turn-helix transcriptional regulator [Anaerolineales bacterium]